MQLDSLVLRRVSLMLPTSCKLQMTARAFRLTAAENYWRRVCARRLSHSHIAVSMTVNGYVLDGPLLEHADRWNNHKAYTRLYRRNSFWDSSCVKRCLFFMVKLKCLA